MNDTCFIWGTSCKEMNLMIHLPRDRYDWEVNSPRAGGKYRIADTASGGMALALEELSKVKLSRWIYQQNQSKEPSKRRDLPKIDINTLKEVGTWPMPSALEQMDYCLQFIESKKEAFGGVDIASHSNEIQAATLLKNESEIRPLIEVIRDEGWIKIKPDVVSDIGIVVILRKGYQRLEELERPQSHQNRS